ARDRAGPRVPHVVAARPVTHLALDARETLVVPAEPEPLRGAETHDMAHDAARLVVTVCIEQCLVGAGVRRGVPLGGFVGVAARAPRGADVLAAHACGYVGEQRRHALL